MNGLTWKAYRDGDRWIIGAAEWQTCTSATYGIISAYSKQEVRSFLRRAAITSLERVNELRRVFWTDSRFEDVEATGVFGPAW